MLKAAGGTSLLSRTCAAIRRSTRARRTPAPATMSNSYATITIYEPTFFCSRTTTPSSALSLQWTQDLQNCPELIPCSNCVGMFMSTARVCFLVQHGYPFVSHVLYPRKHILIGEKTPKSVPLAGSNGLGSRTQRQGESPFISFFYPQHYDHRGSRLYAFCFILRLFFH